jgi:hypothetical protein
MPFYGNCFQSSQDPQQWWIVHLHCWQVQLDWTLRHIYACLRKRIRLCAPFPKVHPCGCSTWRERLAVVQIWQERWESVMRFMACKPVSCAATWVATSMHHVANITVMHGGD